MKADVRLLSLSVALGLAVACGSDDMSDSSSKSDNDVKEAKPKPTTDESITKNESATNTRLEPGEYLSPLVLLKRLEGVQNHLHVDEVKLREDGLLLQCSYTFGVVDAKDAKSMVYLSQNLKHTIPGDMRTPGCVHLAWDKDIVYTTHRGNIRNPAFLGGWDISDPTNPVQIPVLQEPGVSYEGVDVTNGHVFVALHDKGLGVYRSDDAHNLTRVGSVKDLTSAWGVTARGNTIFVADGIAGLVTIDVSDPTNPRVLGRAMTGGQARHIALDGSTAYVAAGSVGLVVVDIADLAHPKVIGTAEMPGTAMRVDYSDGHVFVAAWNDARVYDVSHREQPRFVGAVRLTQELSVDDDDRPASTSRVLGIAARGNDVFIGNWHVLYSYRLHPDRSAPNIRLPEAAAMLDFGPVKSGQTNQIDFEVFNQGTEPLTIFDAWASNDAFTVTPNSMRIPAGKSAVLELTYKATGTDQQSGYLQIHSDDPATPVRQAFLIANQPGLSVGSMLPETTGAMLDGSSWSSAEENGQVMLLNYFATFCPVCGGQLPDIEERFWRPYRDKGLAVIALNAHDTQEQIGEVQEYCNKLELTFPLGLETSKTYMGLTTNFSGLNPFPVDVIVDKTGKIRYIAREYDPEAIKELLDELLAD